MKRRSKEGIAHRAVIEHLRLRGVPRLLWWHTPNGMYAGGRRQGAIMKGLGMLAGVSDLCLLYEGRFHALELKDTKGRLSEAQRRFLDAVKEAGGESAVAFSVDEAVALLEDWGLLRGTAWLRRNDMKETTIDKVYVAISVIEQSSNKIVPQSTKPIYEHNIGMMRRPQPVTAMSSV